MKAQTSFLMKGIYLILVLVTIAIVLNQMSALNLLRATEEKQLELRKSANNILETLTGSDKCLAYREIGATNEKSVELTTHRVIDYEKLQKFSIKYPDIEPECARDFRYRYSIKIEKFNITKIESKKPPSVILPPGNRDIILIFDSSQTMSDQPERITSAKAAALKFIECADETDRLSIVTFGLSGDSWCVVEELFPLTFITTENKETMKNKINSIEAHSGTPLIDSILKTRAILDTESNSSRSRMVILMTDGQETCCGSKCPYRQGDFRCTAPCSGLICSIAESVIPSDVPVYTIGFMITGTAESELMCIANKTNGKYFYSDISKLTNVFCEIAGEKKEKENPESWNFSVETHSRGKAFRSSVTVSTAISIRMSDVKTQPGLLTITVYDGELEQLTGIIDNACLNGFDFEGEISVSYPTYVRTYGGKSYMCMSYEKGEFCLRLSCDKGIVFPEIVPGNYQIKVKTDGKIEVLV